MNKKLITTTRPLDGHNILKVKLYYIVLFLCFVTIIVERRYNKNECCLLSFSGLVLIT